jgi:RND superfamily putative drug exporter
MIFEKIANGVVRHHKKILVAWVVILVFTVPAVMKVNDVLVYQESEMVGGDLESLIAQEIIEEQFPVALANSTLMVVIEGPDMYSPEVRDFCLNLDDLATGEDGLLYLDDFSSVYSVYEGVFYATAAELGPVLYSTEGQVNMTAFLLYGAPSMHVASWVAASDSLNTTERDAAAFTATYTALSGILAEADAATAQLTYSYYASFAEAWNSTDEDDGLVSDPEARGMTAVGEVAPGFIESAFAGEEAAVMYAVLSAFDLSSWSNATLVHGFAMSSVSTFSGIDDMAFLEGVYALGPAPSPEELGAFARSTAEAGVLSTYPVSIPQEYLSSFISEDGAVMLIVMGFSKSSGYLEEGEKPIVLNVESLRDMVAESKELHLPSDYTTYVTGDAALTADMESSMMNEMALIEPITIILIIVLMGFFFRSVVAQFLPLGSVMVALGVSQAVVFVVGSLVADIHYSVVTMLFSILMGVGTDYAIFIVARYREERIKGHAREDAVRTSVTWAGESISTSGATVMISFFALAIADFSMIRTMGLVLGMAIGISLLVALTLVPSLLLVLGNRIFWPTRGERWKRFATHVMERRARGHHGYFHKAANFSIRHAKAVILVAFLVSIPTTYIFVTAETSFDFIGGMSSGVESNEGIIAMTEGFGAGRIMPTEIVVVFATPVYADGNFSFENLDAISAVTSAIDDVENVKTVIGPTNPQGAFIDYANLNDMPAETRAAVESLMLDNIGLDGRTALFTVVLEAGPMTPESLDTVEVLRGELAALKVVDPTLSSAEIYVGGSSAIIYDLKIDLDRQFFVMEVVVVIGIFIVLLIVLGAVLLSAFAIVSIMLSITWAFAATVGVFGYGMGEPILWIIPLILFIMLMGIGMDYNVFILTRIREEIHKGKSDRDAIVESLDWTGGIITALAVIMGSAFSMMMISSTMMLKEMGFALAFAILLDAMVVRTYIVPAMMTLLGRWGWWAPGRLQRERRGERPVKVRELKAGE